MPPATISFLGGNGHCAARLSAARLHLSPEIDLVEVPYPGFEGRPGVADLESFLDAIDDHLCGVAPNLVYATGIGGLLALCLRARGALTGTPILMQGPVLWGIERRWMPRAMRFGPMRRALSRTFATAAFQHRFVRRFFTHAPDSAMTAAFFDGYARCDALSSLFAWLRPALLRSLEWELVLQAGALDGIRLWWGGRDAVVSQREADWTAMALGPAARWPLRVFPEWGHYPMIDAPAEWAEALGLAVAESEAV
jgi:pimeloyl-ACP methyl ester carboxylesterase